MSDQASKGMKFDSGKIRYDLVPWEAREQHAAAMTFGALKYSENNWHDLAEKDAIKSLLRHVELHLQGELVDPDSGVSHLGCAMAQIGFVLWYRRSELPRKWDFKEFAKKWEAERAKAKGPDQTADTGKASFREPYGSPAGTVGSITFDPRVMSKEELKLLYESSNDVKGPDDPVDALADAEARRIRDKARLDGEHDTWNSRRVYKVLSRTMLEHAANLQELVMLLTAARVAYYHDVPILSDGAYDCLASALGSVNPKHQFFSDVGQPRSESHR